MIRCAACADTRRARVLADFGAGRREPPCSGSAKVPLCLGDAGSFRVSFFWVFRRALCFLGLFSAVLFSVGTVFFVWERRKRQHHQRVGAEGSIMPFAKDPRH